MSRPNPPPKPPAPRTWRQMLPSQAGAHFDLMKHFYPGTRTRRRTLWKQFVAAFVQRPRENGLLVNGLPLTFAAPPWRGTLDGRHVDGIRCTQCLLNNARPTVGLRNGRGWMADWVVARPLADGRLRLYPLCDRHYVTFVAARRITLDARLLPQDADDATDDVPSIVNP